MKYADLYHEGIDINKLEKFEDMITYYNGRPAFKANPNYTIAENAFCKDFAFPSTNVIYPQNSAQANEKIAILQMLVTNKFTELEICNAVLKCSPVKHTDVTEIKKDVANLKDSSIYHKEMFRAKTLEYNDKEFVKWKSAQINDLVQLADKLNLTGIQKEDLLLLSVEKIKNVQLDQLIQEKLGDAIYMNDIRKDIDMNDGIEYIENPFPGLAPGFCSNYTRECVQYAIESGLDENTIIKLSETAEIIKASLLKNCTQEEKEIFITKALKSMDNVGAAYNDLIALLAKNKFQEKIPPFPDYTRETSQHWSDYHSKDIMKWTNEHMPSYIDFDKLQKLNQRNLEYDNTVNKRFSQIFRKLIGGTNIVCEALNNLQHTRFLEFAAMVNMAVAGNFTDKEICNAAFACGPIKHTNVSELEKELSDYKQSKSFQIEQKSYTEIENYINSMKYRYRLNYECEYPIIPEAEKIRTIQKDLDKKFVINEMKNSGNHDSVKEALKIIQECSINAQKNMTYTKNLMGELIKEPDYQTISKTNLTVKSR